MATISLTFQLEAPRDQVWEALTDPSHIQAWGGGPAQFSLKPNTQFSLWGGSVRGTLLEFTPPESLVQEWTTGDWTSPSHVTITLTEESSNQTLVTLEQSNVPTDEVEEISHSWGAYCFSPIEHYLHRQRGLPEIEYHQGG